MEGHRYILGLIIMLLGSKVGVCEFMLVLGTFRLVIYGISFFLDEVPSMHTVPVAATTCVHHNLVVMSAGSQCYVGLVLLYCLTQTA